MALASCPSPHRVLYVALQNRGILTLEFNPSESISTSIRILDTTQAGYHPQWLRLNGDKLYSVSRTEFPEANDTSGGLFSFDRSEGGALNLLNNVTSGGLGGVYCDISRDGRTLTAANIDGSTVSVHPLTSDGKIEQASYLFKYTLDHPGPGAGDSQIQSNPHQAIFDPSGQFMFSPDRGADLLRVYRVKGPNDVALSQTIAVDQGSGPRHLTFRVFNSTRTYMYLVSEIDNTVRIFTLDGVVNNVQDQNKQSPDIQISLKQLISTVGLGSNRTAPTNDLLASEVAISNDGKFCYVSNRDTTTYDPDNIAIFGVHPIVNDDRSHLVYLGTSSTYGKIPRHFSLSNDKTNKYAAIGNEVTNSLVIIERDEESGFFSALRGNFSFGDFDLTATLGPTAVHWA